MNAERIGSLFWLILGAASVYGALDLGVGTMEKPGSGFMAFVGGCFVVAMALLIFIQSYRADPRSHKQVSSLWEGVNWWRSVAIVLLTLAFIFSFETLGFFICSFFLMAIIMRWLEDMPWKTSLITPLVAVAATYGLFQTVLNISLPKGIFGF